LDLLYADFEAKRLICIIRNPYDVIFSRLNFISTWTHDNNINVADVSLADQKTINGVLDFGRETLALWSDYYQWWIDVQKKMEVPVYFFRYEDIIKNAEETYLRLFEFMIGQKIPTTSILYKRIMNFKNLSSERTYSKKVQGNLKSYKKFLEPLMT
jgi:hypothetical protein